MTKQVVKEEPDATYPDEVFHKFPNKMKSHATLGPDVAKGDEKHEDSEDLSDENDDLVFDTYNDDETFKNETHPFDPGVFDIENSVVDESSGSRSTINDPLFQHVAPSVVLCLHVLHDCRIILRCIAISLRQLHLHAVNLASSYDVTDSIKPFHIPEVNAEALNEEETFDTEEGTGRSQEELAEKEFGTIGDDEGKPVIHINMIVLV